MAVISVIMGVYNQKDARQLRQAVDSVLGQTMQDLEFLIWDDGSDEEGAKVLREVCSGDERIRLIQGGCSESPGTESPESGPAGRNPDPEPRKPRDPANHGLAWALNGCIEQARGEYIARMDADDICLPERLARQYEYLERHPEIGYVGCGAELFDDRGTWGRREMPASPSAEDYLRYSPFIHPSVTFRTEVLRQAGGYRTARETMRCEDYDLFLRLYLSGCHGYNLPEVLFRYREDRGSFRRRTFRSRMREMRVRMRYFGRLPVSGGKRLLYTVRPLAAALVPGRVIRLVRRAAQG